ncbi:MAG: polyprenyl synthetase family protein [Ignavibacteriales bacterium]|nr:polyprenyl synthetase family protein [Ignavibacteriales bacterium]
MSSPSLSTMSAPIAEEMERFRKIFKTSIRSDAPLVDMIARYLLKRKGKKMRPMLVLLAASAAGGVTERTHRGAVLVELLHTATLVHDDVVDDADVRRGFPSVNAVWKNKAAVLMGDFLLARGLQLAMEGKDFDFLEIVTDAVRRMSVGELRQIQKARKLDIDEPTYFKIVSDKTASLILTCCEIGALSAGEDATRRAALGEYGEALGVAFQIRDDALDFDGSFKRFGKPIGGDVKEKKITLPLIYALDDADEKEAKRVRKLVKNGKKRGAVSEVVRFTREGKGLRKAEAKAREYGDRAKAALDALPDTPAKTSLRNLVDFALTRDR